MGYTVAQHNLYMKGYEWRIFSESGGTIWQPLNKLTSKGTEVSH